jgi:3,4-dihydroxy 2-butanone 4-phosphate synthase/GTP cyclohydrolase II
VAAGSAGFSTIADALADLAAGKFVAVVDTAEQTARGGLTIAAERTTPEAVNFLISEARGPIHLCLDYDRCEVLGFSGLGGAALRSGAAFVVTIDAKHGLATGVSVHERSKTIRLAADPLASAADFVYPGHVPVVRARPGGVLVRARQTEAVVDLARLAGLHASGALAEMLNDEGAVAQGDEIAAWCGRHSVRMISISDLVLYRRRNEQLVETITSVRMPTMRGEFTAVAFRDRLSNEHHVALVKGTFGESDDVLVRVHTQCLLGDVFHSHYCDCAEELDAALARIEAEGKGVVLYISRPERGLGWLWRQEEGKGPLPAEDRNDVRDYGVGSQILTDLGVRRIRILTDHARDLTGLELYGLTVVDQEPLRGTDVGPRREHHQRVPLDDAIV